MTIVIDSHIPYLQGVLEPYAQVVYLDPEAITAQVVREADALIVRTRTKCNESLLKDSKVQFIATATIGFDHIDAAYCASHGITWTACPGCNAQAVCDYVEEAIHTLSIFNFQFSTTPTIGIIGVGHVGSLVQKMALRHGWQVLLNDPPKDLVDGSVETLAKHCDILTFHTPLTMDGNYSTYHMVSEALLRLCKPGLVIINAARGGIIDEEAALRVLAEGKDLHFVVDCWEAEPYVNKAFLAHPAVELASYHIAGYSVEGKRNASQMCLNALCRHFNLPALSILPDDGLRGDNSSGWLSRITQALKQSPDSFESLRKSYPLR